MPGGLIPLVSFGKQNIVINGNPQITYFYKTFKRHSHFSEDEKTMCGFIMKHTNIRGTQNWWLGMRRIVVKTHTDLWNNAIKKTRNLF